MHDVTLENVGFLETRTISAKKYLLECGRFTNEIVQVKISSAYSSFYNSVLAINVRLVSEVGSSYLRRLMRINYILSIVRKKLCGYSTPEIPLCDITDITEQQACVIHIANFTYYL